ncbi:MAG: DJ-1/PfpI family protein [Parvularculaceae bacterium]
MKTAIPVLASFALISTTPAQAAPSATDDIIDVAVVVFDGALTSDIVAPLEVFGDASKKPWSQKLHVEAVAVGESLQITTEEGLKLTANTLMRNAGDYDAVIVPSRYGMDAVLENMELIGFIRNQAKSAKWMASNCSGALILAEAGVLDGKRATTWAGGEKDFQRKYPDVLVQDDVNFVIDDGVLTSSGSIVSYEAAIALLAQLTDEALAGEVAHDLQFARVATATPPPRVYWRIVFLAAGAALIIGGLLASLILAFLSSRRAKP